LHNQAFEALRKLQEIDNFWVRFEIFNSSTPFDDDHASQFVLKVDIEFVFNVFGLCA
jgi:hypothetical protein